MTPFTGAFTSANLDKAGYTSNPLEDGTLAGSVATMDQVFRTLVRAVGVSLVEAVRLCATTPAAQLGLAGLGRIAPGAEADLVVLDGSLRVVESMVAGTPALEH